MSRRSRIPALTPLFLLGLVASPVACSAIIGIEDVDGNDLDAGIGGAAATASASGGVVGSGGASSASGVSSSSGGPCVPGMMTSCYDGPVGTDSVGICKPGMATCGKDGKPAGTCVGEVLPKTEDCSTPEDDDCNGKAGDDTAAGCVCLPGDMDPCPTALLGVCATGMGVCAATGKAFTTCVAPMPATFDDCATSADENCDGKTPACSGMPDWLVNGGANTNTDDSVFSIAALFDGTVAYGGVTMGSISADGLTAPTGDAIFGKVDATGKTQFTKMGLGFAQNYSVIRGIAASADGSIYGVGNFTNTFSFQAPVGQVTAVGGEDVFLFRSNEAGTIAWTKAFGSSADDLSRGIAVDAVNGRVYVVGETDGKLNVGGMVLQNGGGYDAFIACYTLAGVPVWAKSFGDVNDQHTRAVAVASNGDVIFAGDFAGSMALGAGDPTLTSKGSTDIFVMRLTGPTGAYVWAKSYGDVQAQTVRGLAVAPNGDVLMSGGFAGTVNFGGSDLVAAVMDPNDAFAACLDSTGNHVWSRAFAGPSDQIASAVSVDAGGEVVLAGTFSSSITFEAPPLASVGGHDVFFAKLLGKDGTTLWKAGYGNTQEEFAWAASTDPTTNVFFGGNFKGALTLAPGISLTATAGFDPFIAKLAP